MCVLQLFVFRTGRKQLLGFNISILLRSLDLDSLLFRGACLRRWRVVGGLDTHDPGGGQVLRYFLHHTPNRVLSVLLLGVGVGVGFNKQ